MRIKVTIIEVERYPDYDIDIIDHHQGLYTVEVEEEIYDRWNIAISRYNEVQVEIEEVYKSREAELWEKRTEEEIAKL